MAGFGAQVISQKAHLLSTPELERRWRLSEGDRHRWEEDQIYG